MTMDSSRHGWRKTVNRAVRDFASAAASPDEATLRSFLNTMLREIGEALGVDRCVLVELPERGPAVRSGYSWRRTAEEWTEDSFESRSCPALVQCLRLEREPVVLRSVLEVGDDAPIAEAKTHLRQAGGGAALIVPIGVGPRAAWAWVFVAASNEYVWEEAVIEHLQMVGDFVSSALHVRRRAPELVVAPVPVAALPIRARAAPPVRNVVPSSRGFDEIIGEGRALRAALAALEEVSQADSTVLLLGETGTGKELFARALHARGPRGAFPLVSVNCAALPPTLIESELFGHQRGAFTGAVTPRQGRFELAHRGTLFLDEIGDLPLDLQAKLLRVLQEGSFERVGSSQTQAVDVRIIGATHRDLGRAVADGEFRADLYYRLNVFPIRLPPLRERREDIPALVWSIIRKRQDALRRHITTVPAEVMQTLQQYSWPGNIRELENIVERALIHSTGETLVLLDGNLEMFAAEPAQGTTLMGVERAHIEGVLRDCGWRINGLGNAAERLGLHPNTLRFRMKKLGIVRHDSAREPHLRPGRAWAG